ncbi:Mini-ribonuclease 3 [Gracilibacillus marinus]|uniref:Mini-ribonuclease 3 n=1 Tax=Gracilibacillus marinus TaxID=630535 RepID=A0ABV8W1L3_9BACI
MDKPSELKSLALAYIGDAVYEMHIREYLIKLGNVKVQQLHQQAVTYVKATAQAQVIQQWLSEKHLTSEEEAVVRRGRNAKSGSIPKNTSVQAYKYSTAFEALLGFLYLDHQTERLTELMDTAITITEKGDGGNGTRVDSR